MPSTMVIFCIVITCLAAGEIASNLAKLVKLAITIYFFNTQDISNPVYIIIYTLVILLSG